MNSELKIKNKGNRHKVIWTDEERTINTRPYAIPNTEVPFKLADDVKWRRSVFGIFLENFNAQQIQDGDLNASKLAMFDFDFKDFNPEEMKHFDDDNDFAPDLKGLLVKTVRTENVIRGDFVRKNVPALKIVNLPMTVLDDGLRRYTRLQKLVLSGNLIKKVRGWDFPRRLQYLELFANDIGDLKEFAVRGPKKLIYLGLQRNRLQNDSHLHLMCDSGNFEYLRFLDVAENDISDLKYALTALKELISLRYLQLQGNPCAMLCVYKDAVLTELPQLLCLDNTEILPEDRELFKFAADIKAGIIFNCHWIFGLPKPPKQKDVIHAFHFEISMPLLEEEIIEPEIDPELLKSSGTSIPGNKGKGKSKKTEGKEKSEGSSTKKKGKDKKTKSLYDGKDEYESERRSGVTNTSFKTERFSWAKVIQLPEEALVIQSLDGNLADIRDTFRTSVNVKLINLQIENPLKKKKKEKKGKKEKADKKNKSAKGKSKKKGDEAEQEKGTEETVEPPPIVDEPPKEVILKKLTLANFHCDLHSINWSDKTIDYFWADNPKTHPCAAEVQGSLRMINYKFKSAKESITPDTVNPYPPMALPKFFNIQVGFGLKRNYYQD